MGDRSREQLLIDVMLEIGLLTKSEPARFEHMSNDKYCAWIAEILRELKFDTERVGSSWGILKKEE